MTIKENHPLFKETSLEVGGPAEFFCEVNSSGEIVKAIEKADGEGWEVTVLGKGSNVIVSSKGLKGLTIKTEDGNIELLKKDEDRCIVKAGAGVFLPDLSEWALEKSLKGLEWAGGVPGSVGGAVFGNAGAFGRSISDDLREVEIYRNGDKKKVSAEDLSFGYRKSTFKEKGGVVLSALLELKKGDKEEIAKQTKSYLNYRKKNHPIDKPTAGSTFRNPTGEPKKESLQGRPLLKRFTEQGEIPAGYLIEEAELKGESVGGAKFSEKHANFIVNEGEAKTEDVRDLIEKAKAEVKENFDLELKREVRYLPEDL